MISVDPPESKVKEAKKEALRRKKTLKSAAGEVPAERMPTPAVKTPKH